MEQNSSNMDINLPVLQFDITQPYAAARFSNDVAYSFLQFTEEDQQLQSIDDPNLDIFDPNSFIGESPDRSDASDVHLSPNLSPEAPAYSIFENGLTLGQATNSVIPNNKNGLQVRILGVPAKSRVETQIKLCVQLVNSKGVNVTSYKYIALPPNLTVAGKRKKKDDDSKYPDMENFIKLESGVICASDTSKSAFRCFGCVQRERKISQRKKSSDEEEPLSVEEEQQRILQFHSNSRIDFQHGEAIVPTRITCYCRHHDEKTGFQIWLKLKDGRTDQEIATAISTPVMITDDHKSRGKGASPTVETVKVNKRRAIKQEIETEDAPVPTIEKVIPSEGPITGGIEVTILGNDFVNNNRCMFGDAEAIQTNFWGPTTLLCVLPPSLVPGTVPVTIKDVESPKTNMFTYRDESDRLMMELALQVVGMKLTGRIDDARQIAMRIVNSNKETFQKAIKTENQHEHQHKAIADTILNTLQLVLPINTGYSSDINIRNKCGQTMLMLGVVLGHHGLVQFLLTNGADVNLQDVHGFTALSWACYYGYVGIAQILLGHNPVLTLQDKEGRTACDVARANGHEFVCEAISKKTFVDAIVEIRETPKRNTEVKIPTKFRSTQPTSISSDDVFTEETNLLHEETSPRPKKSKNSWYFNQFKHYLFQYRAVFSIVVCVLIGTVLLTGVIPWDSEETSNVTGTTKTNTQLPEQSTSIVDNTKIEATTMAADATGKVTTFQQYMQNDRNKYHRYHSLHSHSWIQVTIVSAYTACSVVFLISSLAKMMRRGCRGKYWGMVICSLFSVIISLEAASWV